MVNLNVLAESLKRDFEYYNIVLLKKEEAIDTIIYICKTSLDYMLDNILELSYQDIPKDIYTSIYELYQIQLEDIWSISYKKGEYHTPHDHGSTGLTGIIYLKMPKDGAVTQYIQPWNDWYSDRTIYYPLPVKEGDIVVVPKFVRHFTEPSKSKKIKRIISWDMKIS